MRYFPSNSSNRWLRLAAAVAAAGSRLPLAAAVSPENLFESRVRPLLVEHCFECHAGDTAEGGLRLDSQAGFAAGGDSGPVIHTAEPNNSLLLQLVRHEVADREMPQGADRLTDRDIADLTRWVALGLPGLPAEPAAAEDLAAETWAAKLADRRNHWAWQPVKPQAPPTVQHPVWSATAIDRFLLAAIHAAGLEPAGPADRATLIRRLTLALTGLPPTPAEVDAFLECTDPGAVEALVDRLLASPAFGEHWGGYWLDLMRFGETGGYVRDYPIPEAWRYRDYCIRAFNADLPYDRFVAEHLAGDLLPPRPNPVLGINEAVLGTGHLRLMEISSTATDVALEEAQMVESQIDTLGKAFQALTISCARCHDHKFDAISQRDYYALFGALASGRQTQAIIDDEAVRRTGVDELGDLKGQIAAALAAAWREDLAAVGTALAAELAAVPATTLSAGAAAPAAIGPRAPALRTLLAAAATSADHPLHAVAVAREAARAGEDPVAAFAKSAAAVRAVAAERRAKNSPAFTVAADFTASPSAWHAGGVLPDTIHRGGSDLALAPEGDEIIARVIGPGFATDRLSQKHGGTVRSEDFPLAAKFVSLRVAGGDAAHVRLIQHNFQQMENVAHGSKVRHIDSRLPTWVTLPVGHQASWQGGRHLGFAGHHDEVHFRNIRVKRLGGETAGRTGL